MALLSKVQWNVSEKSFHAKLFNYTFVYWRKHSSQINVISANTKTPKLW